MNLKTLSLFARITEKYMKGRWGRRKSVCTANTHVMIIIVERKEKPFKTSNSNVD